MHILIVEDEEAIRELISLTLQGGGYTVSTACDGLEALEKLKARAPDALLLDINMPRMDGLTLLGQLKGDPLWNSLPVLMLTAQSSPADIRQAMKLGADDYIGKPFEPRQLLRRIERLLGRS